MVSISIQNKPEFNIIGLKTWISGADNELFSNFWGKCIADSEIEQILKFVTKNNSVTKSEILGFSCTEKDPNV